MMINQSRAEEDTAVPVLITQKARQIAHQFAQQQPDGAKAQQIYLNTLAVCTLNNYLKILGIPSDPSNCDSWNPLMRMTTNIADLEVIGRGRIECRPISAWERETNSQCYLPTEVQDERIAYVVMQIEPEQSEALILGFVEQVDSEVLPLNRLRPISDFPMYLDQYSLSDRVTQLSNWLQGQIETGWQTIEEILGISLLNYQWRNTRSLAAESTTSNLSGVVRGKVLEVPISQGIEPIVLITELIPKSEEELSIELKICPPTKQTFLPVGLEMTVVDAVGEAVMHTQARDENRMIELGFNAESGDCFSLRIKLAEVTIEEEFVV
ncbi:MAG: DUF1822 family protein [Symploca sp. SIO1C4]|uniref:DUF1822 family protein n=1 Tax=Symploca sp. SIO1C4 TaxID=2607765 RepID=A0A6B3NGY5_9CYAN|nr:DUF1822 family protein [Symploca sp. SIO1C4]